MEQNLNHQIQSEELPIPGEVIAGRYMVLDILGSGGMGVVYRVEQVFLNSIHALKVLTTIDPSSMVRFQTEARITFRFQHPNLVAVTDLGTLDNGMPFLVMDFVDGSPLSQRLQSLGSIPLAEALDIYMQVCDGLSVAHEMGIVHRDLKPSNIMICAATDPSNPSSHGTDSRSTDSKTSDENTSISCLAKIIDFGIARVIQGEQADALCKTRTGEIFGSPIYMSPEQCGGKTIDTRSDIYSFGCALFETLTGKPPFVGENALATMMMHQFDTPPTLQSQCSDSKFPVELEMLVSSLLAKDPADRIQTILAVKEHLRRVKDKSPGAKSHSSQKRTLLLAAISIALPLILCSAILLTSFSNSPRTAPLSTVTLKSVEKREIAEIKDMKPYSEVSLQESRRHHLHWVFNFPEEFSLGRARNLNAQDLAFQQAQGRVLFEPGIPLKFEPLADLIRQPEYLSRFRPDDISELYYTSSFLDEALVNDEILFSLSHLTGLKTLGLPESGITDKGLISLNNLDNLTALNVNDCGQVTGQGLANCKILPQLVELRASHIKDVSTLIDALSGSKAIKRLKLTDTAITDKDLDKLALCPNLEMLNIAHSMNITDSGLGQLSELKYLTRLDIDGCPITPGISKYLRPVHPMSITIDRSQWTSQEKLETKKSMPNCIIEDAKKQLPIE